MSNMEIFFWVIAALLAAVAGVDVLLDLFDWFNKRKARRHGK